MAEVSLDVCVGRDGCERDEAPPDSSSDSEVEWEETDREVVRLVEYTGLVERVDGRGKSFSAGVFLRRIRTIVISDKKVINGEESRG